MISAKITLVEALKMFNRKERYWLIRNALGVNSEKLDSEFRKLLKEKHFIEVPENAWWAMDYQIDWLIGALHLFKCQGEEAVCEKPEINKPQLFTGTIQDIDFLVAFKNTLIFIEAKGDAPWNCEQLNSKIGRLQNIVKEFNSVETHFLLISPKPPQKKRIEKSIESLRLSWIFAGDKPRWLPLQIITDEHNPNITRFEDFYHVRRCDKNIGPANQDSVFMLRNGKSDLRTKTVRQ
jgi:hypothetical protein